MPEIIEKAMHKAAFVRNPELDDLIQSNSETRRITTQLIENKK
jgi:1-deoxy-D-xylulose-5-phosphate reductoisomerase